MAFLLQNTLQKHNINSGLINTGCPPAALIKLLSKTSKRVASLAHMRKNT